jgi:hypothetical protein
MPQDNQINQTALHGDKKYNLAILWILDWINNTTSNNIFFTYSNITTIEEKIESLRLRPDWMITDVIHR